MSHETRQIIERNNAADRTRMLAGLLEPRQEPFVFQGDVDWDLYDMAKFAYVRRYSSADRWED